MGAHARLGLGQTHIDNLLLLFRSIAVSRWV